MLNWKLLKDEKPEIGLDILISDETKDWVIVATYEGEFKKDVDKFNTSTRTYFSHEYGDINCDEDIMYWAYFNKPE